MGSQFHSTEKYKVWTEAKIQTWRKLHEIFYIINLQCDKWLCNPIKWQLPLYRIDKFRNIFNNQIIGESLFLSTCIWIKMWNVLFNLSHFTKVFSRHQTSQDLLKPFLIHFNVCTFTVTNCNLTDFVKTVQY